MPRPSQPLLALFGGSLRLATVVVLSGDVPVTADELGGNAGAVGQGVAAGAETAELGLADGMGTYCTDGEGGADAEDVAAAGTPPAEGADGRGVGITVGGADHGEDGEGGGAGRGATAGAAEGHPAGDGEGGATAEGGGHGAGDGLDGGADAGGTGHDGGATGGWLGVAPRIGV